MTGIWALTNGFERSADTADDFGGNDAPKLKFLFTVEFTFRTIGVQGSQELETITLAAKQATRPSPVITYQEVNYYNFIHKIQTKVDPGAVSVTFYDDNKNKAHDMFESYIKSVSPVTNLSRDNADILDTLGFDGSGSTAPLTVNRHGVIKNIRVTHHYNPDYSPGGHERIHYDYMNPKITNMILDDLDMTVSDSSSLTFNFVYDGVNIVKE